MEKIDYEEILETLVILARKVGEIIANESGRVKFQNKESAVDLLTETDEAVEQIISSALSSKYPEFEFLGEESFIPGQTKLSAKPTFVVDPIDGTTNFIHFFPHACISLALTVDYEPVIGVVYNPFYDQMFTAIKGKGSFLNGERLPLRDVVKRALTLQGALVGIEWGADRSPANYEIKTATFKSLGAQPETGGAFVHGFRSMGSAALNLATVAAGQLDCYWEGGYHIYDICAGYLILEEAGGMAAGANPEDWHPGVAGRAHLAVRPASETEQKTFVQAFWSHVPGNMEYD